MSSSLCLQMSYHVSHISYQASLAINDFIPFSELDDIIQICHWDLVNSYSISSVNIICLKVYWPGNLISLMSVNIWYQAAIFHLHKFMVRLPEWNYVWPRADSRFAPSQWETVLLCNDVSHWLGANVGSALLAIWWAYHICILPWWGNYSSSQDTWLTLHSEHAYVMTWT